LYTDLYKQLIECLHYYLGLASSRSTSWVTSLATLCNLGMEIPQS
jgi:hypothetical protein